MGGWQPIESAPKEIVRRLNSSEYGEYILLYAAGEIIRGRWWQSMSAEARAEGYQNFLADGGRAIRPTHWMPLPEPPQSEAQR